MILSFFICHELYYNPNTSLPDPYRNGVCYNFLCDTVLGITEIFMEGPVVMTMLLPPYPNTNVIVNRTRTGVSPISTSVYITKQPRPMSAICALH